MRSNALSRSAARSLGIAAAVAVIGALAGLAAAPRTAAASTTERAGWTCFETDRCHSGTADCCDDPDKNKDLTHCTTVCP